MKPSQTCILTIKGGSSSIKFTLYQTGEPLEQRFVGKVDRIGLPGTNLTFSDPTRSQQNSRSIQVSDHSAVANFLIDWLEEQNRFAHVKAVGHRVVHGMKHTEPERVTQELLDELYRISPYDPDRLLNEIELIEAFRQRHPKLPQVACFDTAFHRTMPPVARLLPIPRRFDAMGIQRYGFHGLSYAYLFENSRMSPARKQPKGERRMGANPHADGGILLRDLRMPDFRDYAEDVPSPGLRGVGDKGIYLKQQLKDKLIENKQHIDKYGEGLPEIRNWKWSPDGT